MNGVSMRNHFTKDEEKQTQQIKKHVGGRRKTIRFL